MNAPPRLSTECTSEDERQHEPPPGDRPRRWRRRRTAITHSSKPNVSSRLITTETGSSARGKRIDRISPRLDEIEPSPRRARSAGEAEGEHADRQPQDVVVDPAVDAQHDAEHEVVHGRREHRVAEVPEVAEQRVLVGGAQLLERHGDGEVAPCPHVGEVATGRQLGAQRSQVGGGVGVVVTAAAPARARGHDTGQVSGSGR